MDNQEKIQELVDELYVLHKEAGERMVKLTEENKKTLNEMQDSQKKMREFVEEKVASEQRWNMRFIWFIFWIFVIIIAIIIYVIIFFRSEVKYSIRDITNTVRENDGVTARLYLEQKEFIEKNKCNVKEEDATAKNKLKGK
jgi:cytoskeletal protein RodZ